MRYTVHVHVQDKAVLEEVMGALEDLRDLFGDVLACAHVDNVAVAERVRDLSKP